MLLFCKPITTGCIVTSMLANVADESKILGVKLFFRNGRKK